MSEVGRLDGARIVTAVDFPYWLEDRGKAVRVLRLLESLQRLGAEVHVFYPRPLQARQAERILERGAASATGVAPGPVASALRRLATGLGIDPKAAGLPGRGRAAAALRRLARVVRPHALLIEYLHLAWLRDEAPRGCTAVIDTLDVRHLHREVHEQRGIHYKWHLTREDEAELLRKFDLIVAIQDADAAVFRDMVPGREVVTVRVAYDPAAASGRGAAQKGPVVLFIGCSSPANLLGLQEFLDQAWPRVRQDCPDARLVVAGNVGGQVAAVAGVEIRGFVDDLEALYEEAAVVISPVTFGGGLKVKCGEALAHGKACVFSPHSAIGYEDGAGAAFRVAQGWREFAGHVVELARMPDRRLALESAARNYVGAALSREATAAALAAALRQRSGGSFS